MGRDPPPPGSRFSEYDYLLSRVSRWSMLDLDDLMLEIETDEGLTDAERHSLLSRLYALLWRRAQAEFAAPRNASVTPEDLPKR